MQSRMNLQITIMLTCSCSPVDILTLIPCFWSWFVDTEELWHDFIAGWNYKCSGPHCTCQENLFNCDSLAFPHEFLQWERSSHVDLDGRFETGIYWPYGYFSTWILKLRSTILNLNLRRYQKRPLWNWNINMLESACSCRFPVFLLGRLRWTSRSLRIFAVYNCPWSVAQPANAKTMAGLTGPRRHLEEGPIFGIKPFCLRYCTAHPTGFISGGHKKGLRA